MGLELLLIFPDVQKGKAKETGENCSRDITIIFLSIYKSK